MTTTSVEYDCCHKTYYCSLYTPHCPNNHPNHSWSTNKQNQTEIRPHSLDWMLQEVKSFKSSTSLQTMSACLRLLTSWKPMGSWGNNLQTFNKKEEQKGSGKQTCNNVPLGGIYNIDYDYYISNLASFKFAWSITPHQAQGRWYYSHIMLRN